MLIVARRRRDYIKCLIWWQFTPQLEPILPQKTDLSRAACAGKPARVPPEKPFELF